MWQSSSTRKYGTEVRNSTDRKHARRANFPPRGGTVPGHRASGVPPVFWVSVRIRAIKPEFWVSESVGRLTRNARLLFIGLWSFADDSGRGRGAFPAISGALFPYDDDALEHVQSWFGELVKEGMVRRYQAADGNWYYDIPKWLKHQKIEKPSKPLHPPFTEDSPNTPRILPDISALEQGTGNREQGTVSPHTPQGGDGVGLFPDLPPPPASKSNGLHPEQLRLNALFRIRASTKWPPQVVKAWKGITPIPEEDLAAIERYYATPTRPTDIRRRGLATLLNNWFDEVIRAKNYNPPSCL